MSSLWCIFFKFLITKQEDFCTLPLYIAKGNKQYEIIKALAFEENGEGEDIANRAFNENDSDEEMQHALDWTAPLLRHSGPDTYATRMNECTKAVEYQLNIQALPCLYAENCYSSMQRKYVTFLTQEKKM